MVFFFFFLLILVGVSVGWMFALFIGVMSSILRDLSTKAVGGATGLNTDHRFSLGRRSFYGG